MEDLAHHNPKSSPSPDTDTRELTHILFHRSNRLGTPESSQFRLSGDLGCTQPSSQSDSENTTMET